MNSTNDVDHNSKANEPKKESWIRRFFRAFFSATPVPRESFAMYGRDWPYIPDERVPQDHDEMRCKYARYASIRGLY